MAAEAVQDLVTHAAQCLVHPNLDAIRLSIQIENMENRCLPLLEAMSHTENMPMVVYDWLYVALRAYARLVEDLREAHSAACGT